MSELDRALQDALGDGASVGELLSAVAAAVQTVFADAPLIEKATRARMVRQIQELANRI